MSHFKPSVGFYVVSVWRVVQCAAVCCSVLQCVAVCCSVLQCVAVWCSSVSLAFPKHCDCVRVFAHAHMLVHVYVHLCVNVCMLHILVHVRCS